MADVKDVVVESPRRVVFHFSSNENRELPLILGGLPVLPKHFFDGRDFTKPLTDPPIGSGPYRIASFEEKPRHGRPTPSAFNPAKVSASMGIYIFNTGILLRALVEDSEDAASSHDFGRDVIPNLLGKARVIAYNFQTTPAVSQVIARAVRTSPHYRLAAVIPNGNHTVTQYIWVNTSAAAAKM